MSDTNSLTRRETETLNLLAEGLSNDEVASQLGISPNTVKVHVRNIFEKMAVQSRTEATMEAVRRGWIQVPGVDTASESATEMPYWPPLESNWRHWQPLVVLAVLVIVAAMVFWPNRAPAAAVTGVPDFATDSGSVSGSVSPRQDVARWSQRAGIPTARSRAAGSQIDGRLFVVGGETSDGDSDVMEMYNPDLDVWQSLPPRPVAVRSAAAATLGGRLYVAGGCAGEVAINNVDRYDPQNQIWETVASLPEARCGLALVALDDRIYAVGGWDGAELTDTLFIYDPATDRWEEGRRLPESRAFLGAVPLQGKIYALGGHDGTQQRTEMWNYDPLDDTWNESPSLPEARSGLASAAEGVSIYAIGGGEGDQPPIHERFDTLTQTWSTIDSPYQGPWHHAVAVVIGPNLYIVGGWGGEYLTNTEAYQASHLLFLPLGVQGLQ